MIPQERKWSALYRRVSEPSLSPKGGWPTTEWNLYAKNEICMPRLNSPKDRHVAERKGWALDRKLSELLLSPKEGWRKMKLKLYAKVQHPGKPVSFWEEELSSLPEGDWGVAKS